MTKGENQHIEFKESWRDEHLKTICGFANTAGGTIFIGKDDSGNALGISNCKKLLEDIPTQIKNTLGILATVNQKREKGKDVIVIKVKACQQPVSFKGKFYKRSGSTTLEVNGTELQNFLLEKNNITWESVIEKDATLEDLDQPTIKMFWRLAINRFPIAAGEKSIAALLEKLHLYKKGKLTRAAILLFGKNPQKFYPNSYIKIGRFKNEDSIISMDDIYGNLFLQVTKTMELLKVKYLHTDITIETLHRKEKLEYPEVALREGIVNAIVHRDYSYATSQIKVYADYLSIWNNGELSNKLTLDKLKRKHPSFPRNELIASMFYYAGYIEKWGHGTVKMIEECKKAGLPEPVFEQESGGMQVTILKDIYHEEFLKRLLLNERQIKAVQYVKRYGQITNAAYRQLAKTSKRTATTDLQVLVDKGILLKLGVTGKGTQYVLQRGNKGAKGAISKVQNELDRKLLLLEKELDEIDPLDEVQWNFNKEVFFSIFDSWLRDLCISILPVIQKFNRLFNKSRHHIFVFNGVGQVPFSGDDANKIISLLREDCINNSNQIGSDTTITFKLGYYTFRKGGLKTFSCTYEVEIHFTMYKYEIFIGEFDLSTSTINRVLQFEKLLHQPVSKVEIEALCAKLGESIYQYLDYFTIQQGLRKGQQTG